MMPKPLSRSTRTAISQLFARLDYKTLAPVYCYEGGDEFWQAKRGPCERTGEPDRPCAVRIASTRMDGGLYVGAGVAELPPLLMETIDLHREVEPYNLRRTEVTPSIEPVDPCRFASYP